MAKETKWHDVRLLSFDLQTVEFSYARVRMALVLLQISKNSFLIRRISRIIQSLFPAKINYPPLVVTLTLTFLEFLLRVQRVPMIQQIASTHMKTQNLSSEIS